MSLKYPYAKVVLPLAVEGSYSYIIPENLQTEIRKGSLVLVPFGARRIYTGLVLDLELQSSSAEKEVLDVLEQFDSLGDEVLSFYRWLSKYYCAYMGQVLTAVLPSRFRIQSETKIKYIEKSLPPLSAEYGEIWKQLYHTEEMKLLELIDTHGRKRSFSAIELGIENGFLQLSEQIEKNRINFQRHFVQLGFDPKDEALLETAYESTARAPSQRELLLWALDHLREPKLLSTAIKESGFQSALFKALVKKSALLELKLEYLGAGLEHGSLPLPSLSEAQDKAADQLKEIWKNHTVGLLKGVTGSGKTEIYIHLLDDILKRGDNGLMLVPEIALTTQLIDRLGKYFGDNLMIYHSRLSKGERAKTWKKILMWKKGDRPYLMLGVRSSLLLPFRNIGLIVIDEEHDPSYKQNDPAPRYQGRDSAIMLATLMQAKVLLGSATPSLESWRNAVRGKYGLVELGERYGGVKMPEIWAVDLKPLRKAAIKGILSPKLRDAMKEVLDKGKQVVLFQNRRGFSGAVECDDCGWVPYCPNCDVALTYHKYKNKLNCHYCGYADAMPIECHSCGHQSLKTTSYGTERVEEEVKLLFPDRRTARLDLDITRKKNAFKQIIGQFEEAEIDILIGTQMVTKGLDFENLELVGILQADQSLHFPDFRANERTFQLLTQVAGRAGRREHIGKVLIQTYQPPHPVIQAVVHSKDEHFYREEIMSRQELRYPPFVKLVHIELAHKDHRQLDEGVRILSDGFRNLFGQNMLGPVVPRIGRIQQWYLRDILIRMDLSQSAALKKQMMEMIELKRSFIEVRRLRIKIDVDPV